MAKRILILLAFAIACAVPYLVKIDLPGSLTFQDSWHNSAKFFFLTAYCGAVCVIAMKLGSGRKTSKDTRTYVMIWSASMAILIGHIVTSMGMITVVWVAGRGTVESIEQTKLWSPLFISVSLALYSWHSWQIGRSFPLVFL